MRASDLISELQLRIADDGDLAVFDGYGREIEHVLTDPEAGFSLEVEDNG
jgi:hypothetical protein